MWKFDQKVLEINENAHRGIASETNGSGLLLSASFIQPYLTVFLVLCSPKLELLFVIPAVFSPNSFCWLYQWNCRRPYFFTGLQMTFVQCHTMLMVWTRVTGLDWIEIIVGRCRVRHFSFCPNVSPGPVCHPRFFPLAVCCYRVSLGFYGVFNVLNKQQLKYCTNKSKSADLKQLKPLVLLRKFYGKM